MVVMYSKSWCPYCQRAAALLARKGIPFETVDVEQHPDRRDEMIQRSGRRTVPQIFIDATHVGGSDDLHELEAAGELDKLLAGQH
jgi:glutaredoxin 3